MSAWKISDGARIDGHRSSHSSCDGIIKQIEYVVVGYAERRKYAS